MEILKTWATEVPPPETKIAAQRMAVSFPSQDDRCPPASESERGGRIGYREDSHPNDGTDPDRSKTLGE